MYMIQAACLCLSSLSPHHGRFLEVMFEGASFARGAMVTVWDGILSQKRESGPGTINSTKAKVQNHNPTKQVQMSRLKTLEIVEWEGMVPYLILLILQ